MESLSRQNQKQNTNYMRVVVLKWCMSNTPVYNKNMESQQREGIANRFCEQRQALSSGGRGASDNCSHAPGPGRKCSVYPRHPGCTHGVTSVTQALTHTTHPPWPEHLLYWALGQKTGWEPHREALSGEREHESQGLCNSIFPLAEVCPEHMGPREETRAGEVQAKFRELPAKDNALFRVL